MIRRYGLLSRCHLKVRSLSWLRVYRTTTTCSNDEESLLSLDTVISHHSTWYTQTYIDFYTNPLTGGF